MFEASAVVGSEASAPVRQECGQSRAVVACDSAATHVGDSVVVPLFGGGVHRTGALRSKLAKRRAMALSDESGVAEFGVVA